MARLSKSIGRYRDVPLLSSYSGAAASGGTSADFEFPIIALPDPTSGAPGGATGAIASNTISVRFCLLTFISTVTGQATNNCTFAFLQKRGGALVVNTTSSTTIVAGTNVVTPASMAGIVSGVPLVFDGGTGATETITPYNLTSTTFTANFASGHSGAYTITSAPLASITFGSGVNATALVPIQFARQTNYIQHGDVITIARVSSNATGLATPAFQAVIDWAPSGVN